MTRWPAGHFAALALPALLALAWGAPPASAAGQGLAAALVERGFESVRVDTAGPLCRIRLENRRYRNPNLGLGVIAALAARERPGPCEIVLERQGLAVARLSFESEDFVAFGRGDLDEPTFFGRLRVEVLPDAAPDSVPALSPALRRVDLAVRLLFDSQFGHIQEPFDYHVEIAPELATQPWRSALLRLGWSFPIRHERDIAASAVHPDYLESRPEEAVLYQFVRVGPGLLASLGAGYLGLNRYGTTAGLGARLGPRVYLDGSADLTGSVAFWPEVSYSGLTRVTFSGGATYRPPSPDLALTVRAGRYLYGNVGAASGEYAVRGEADRRFHQVEVGFFAILTESNRLGGFRLSVPFPPAVRLRPAALRPNPLPAFPIEYRTEEGPWEVSPADPRLRSALLDDLWPSSVRAQLDQWRAGYRLVAGEGP